MLLGNIDQLSVEVLPGDIVAAVIAPAADEASALPAGQVDGGEPSVAHIWQDWDVLRDIAEVDVPPDGCYAALRRERAVAYPAAGEALLEHLDALEALLDVCIASGYSSGASKSRDRLCQPALESLGEVAGRDGLDACEHHLRIIKEWGDISDVSALRRFLGTFNWVRGHFPIEVQAAVAPLTSQLRKGAEFPLGPVQVKAKRAIQELACRAIRLQGVDMIGVATGDRPLEQVADFCPFGWGGTVYQLSPDFKTLNVLGMYGGALSLELAP